MPDPMAVAALWAAWILDGLGSVWILLVCADLLAQWIGGRRSPGWFRFQIGRAADFWVNCVRWVFPTVFREVDWAPAIGLLLLVALQALVFRGLMVWGLAQDGL